jgi:anthranilate phosphoribosyltransferase
MNHEIRTALELMLEGRDLSAEEMQAAMAVIMDGRAGGAETAALLTALSMKGEAVAEIVGAARAMQDRATKIPTTQQGLLDTCGTGGDGLQTFNISTATAFVAAAAGVRVAKHGNRSVSSSSGSADVLEALGVNIELPPEQVGRCIDELGIGFCFARLLHTAMKHVAPVRQELGFRTIFNLLGPLTNPAGAEFQLLGANTPEAAKKLAFASAELNRKKVIVVCGAGELDEVCLWGETVLFTVSNGAVDSQTCQVTDFGLSECRVEDLQVSSADESAAVIRNIFDGEPGPAREIVLANAAVALMAAGHTHDLQTGVSTAAEAIDSGKAAELCRNLADVTNR